MRYLNSHRFVSISIGLKVSPFCEKKDKETYVEEKLIPDFDQFVSFKYKQPFSRHKYDLSAIRMNGRSDQIRFIRHPIKTVS